MRGRKDCQHDAVGSFKNLEKIIVTPRSQIGDGSRDEKIFVRLGGQDQCKMLGSIEEVEIQAPFKERRWYFTRS